MKTAFKYVGILALMCFSFYYADKVAKFMKAEDSVMKTINEYAAKYNTECREGYITEEGVVLGVSGLAVDTELSYSEMKGIGFEETLLEYKEASCIVSKVNNRDDYIIKGNEARNSISLIIEVNSGKQIKEILKIAQTKNAKLSFLTDRVFLKNNKETALEIINGGHDILYMGENNEDLKDFLNILKSINKEKETFCVYNGGSEMLDYCYKNEVNTIKPNKIYTSNYLSNIKMDISKGEFFILKESTVLKNELGVIINYIRSKGLKVVSISDHLSS